MQQSINVLFSPSKNVVIDEVLSNGLTRYARETEAQVKLRYEDAVLIDLDEAIERMESKLKSLPRAITEAQYYDGLGQLPPKNFFNGKEATTFMMEEHLSGMITGIYVSIKGHYFCFNDSCFMKHVDIVNLVKTTHPALFQ